MKRIIVGKKESIAELIERVIEDDDAEILLVVPRGASAGESVSNFHLLKREADAAGKAVSVESVDEGVLGFARSSHIEAFHPLLGDIRRGSVSDIISKGTRPEGGEVVAKLKTRQKAKTAKTSQPPEESATFRHQDDSREDENGGSSKKFTLFGAKPGVFLGCLAVVLFVLAAGFVIDKFFSHATIAITFQKAAWSYDHPFVADVAVSKASVEKASLPAELFTLQRNVTQLFPASGKSNVALKSAGKIYIYNDYSSKPQVLVQSTRFEAPDGKVFRIVDQVVVPGAEIKDGKIVPSKIAANIVADKAGPEYNVGPIAKLTIPGFKGSPRYNSFYGEIAEPTKGGFTGEKPVPTADDLVKAKNKTTEILETGLKSNFLASYPSDFKILDDASDIRVTKSSVNENTDQNGKFSVFGEATMRAIGFKESDMKSLLLALARQENPHMVFRELRLDYKSVSADFKNKKVAFGLAAAGELWPDFKERDFAVSVLGKKVSEVRSMIAALEGLSSAKISVWPVWLGAVPRDPNKVTISVY